MEQEKQPENLGPPEEDPTEGDSEQENIESNLQDQLDEALREKDQFRLIAQRAQADLINYRKRASDEQDEARRNANSQFVLKLLSVVDDMERALDMVPQDAVAPGWLEGLQLVHHNLSNVLESEGVSKIEAQGKLFEPWEHEAVLYEETSDAEEGQVVRVVREGYKLRDRVLRAAQVVVAKAAESDTPPESTQEEI